MQEKLITQVWELRPGPNEVWYRPSKHFPQYGTPFYLCLHEDERWSIRLYPPGPYATNSLQPGLGYFTIEPEPLADYSPDWPNEQAKALYEESLALLASTRYSTKESALEALKQYLEARSKTSPSFFRA